jgi:hypothetical protein
VDHEVIYGLVAELGHILGLPVVVASWGVGGIDQRLGHRVRHRLYEVHLRRAELFERSDPFFAVVRRASVKDDETDDWLALHVLRIEWRRRRGEERRRATELVRGLFQIILPEAQEFFRPGDRGKSMPANTIGPMGWS